MTEIIKFVALFIFCNGAGCNCTQNPEGGSFDFVQIVLGLIVYLLAVIIDRYETKN
jgi:hypothetical protein